MGEVSSRNREGVVEKRVTLSPEAEKEEAIYITRKGDLDQNMKYGDFDQILTRIEGKGKYILNRLNKQLSRCKDEERVEDIEQAELESGSLMTLIQLFLWTRLEDVGRL